MLVGASGAAGGCTPIVAGEAGGPTFLSGLIVRAELCLGADGAGSVRFYSDSLRSDAALRGRVVGPVASSMDSGLGEARRV